MSNEHDESSLKHPLKRLALLGVSAGLVAGVANAGHAATTKSGSKTFVLVHGAWHGAWCWRHVKADLEKRGHRVFAPTLTGMGDRHHLSSASIDLNTHIRDVLATIETEELNDVVLVGHSYAGYLAFAARQQMPERLRSVMYLDAMLPIPGKAARDTWPPDLVAQTEKTLIDGFKLASFPVEMFDVPPTDKANTEWMKRRLTDMPYGVFKTPFPEAPQAKAERAAQVPQVFVKCTEAKLDGAKYSLEAAKAMKMKIVMMKAGHNPMVTAPKAFVDLLLANA
jgi:pimeloyl-ACP methyl ester carboxylesterase